VFNLLIAERESLEKRPEGAVRRTMTFRREDSPPASRKWASGRLLKDGSSKTCENVHADERDHMIISTT